MYTSEDIKNAFIAGRNSTDKFAHQKGFALNEDDYLKQLEKSKTIEVKSYDDLYIIPDEAFYTSEK